MPRFSLRTLIIVMLLGGPVLAGVITLLVPRSPRPNSLRAQAQADSFAIACEQYRLDTGEFPNSLSDLLVKPPHLDAPQQWQGPYIDRQTLPKDPWGQAYRFLKIRNGIRVWSRGPDAADARDDIVACAFGKDYP